MERVVVEVLLLQGGRRGIFFVFSRLNFCFICAVRAELLGFPFVDPFEERQRKAQDERERQKVEGGGGAGTDGEEGAAAASSKEKTPEKQRKAKHPKNVNVIKVHKVKVDEVPEIGDCPDPYY